MPGVILRGIRAVSDYEYELQMALMNASSNRGWRRVYASRRTYSYLSSKLVREIAHTAAPLTDLVPPSSSNAAQKNFLSVEVQANVHKERRCN